MSLTFDETVDLEDRLTTFIARTPPRDLTPAEYAALLPPRGPKGCGENRVRGSIISALNRKGYTVRGERCT